MPKWHSFFFMKKIIILFLFICHNLWAIESSLNYTLTHDGDQIELKLYQYKNANGVEEIRIEADEVPRIWEGINPILGYGRDLNDDGKVDTWWMIKKDEGINRLENMPCIRSFCTDAIYKIMTKFYQTPTKMYVNAVVGSMLGYLFMSVNSTVDAWKTYNIRSIDIEEFEIRWKREMDAMSYLYLPEQTQMYRQMMITALDTAINDIESAHGSDYFQLGAADMGLWYAGGVLIKYIGKAMSYMGTMLTKIPGVNSLHQSMNKMMQNMTAKYTARMNALKLAAKKNQNKLGRAVIFTSKNVFGYLKKANLNFMARAKLVANITKTKVPAFLKGFATGVKADSKYIMLNLGIQFSSETYAHYDDVYDPNPIKMAQNILSNDEIQQNVSYMASETILMTGVSHNIKSTKAKFAVCGAIALGNSTLTNLVIRDSEDYERVAMDTGWEMVIGNAQVQLDLATLRYFEELSVKNKNPKLKLVGYAITMVDQAVGYYGYSKAASKLKDEPTVSIAPVFSEK
jgi:hypothetical protein